MGIAQESTDRSFLCLLRRTPILIGLRPVSLSIFGHVQTMKGQWKEGSFTPGEGGVGVLSEID